MLNTPAPFPEVGSYGLLNLDGRTHLARIQHRLENGEAMVSLPLLRDVASGNRRVRLAALVDGTPLTPEERDEMTNVRAASRAGRRGAKAAKARWEALQERDTASRTLADLLARLPDPARRASLRDAA